MNSSGYKMLFVILFLGIASYNVDGFASQDHCAEFVQIMSPASDMEPNAIMSVNLLLKNCGNFDWPKDKVFVSHHWYKDGKLIKWDDFRVPITNLTLTNQIASITSTLKAPYSVGDYIVRFDLVYMSSTGEQWFSESNNPTGNIKITVKVPIIIGSFNMDGFFPPQINTIYPYTLRPRVKVLLQGENFSTKKGKVFMVLPSGNVINLNILNWWDKIIVAQVPNIVGEVPGTATIFVQKHTLNKSNILGKSFEPDLEIKVLSGNWKLDHCGDPHACEYNCSFGGSTIGAYHYNNWSWGWPFSSGCWDTDTYTISNKLQNGWTYEGHQFWYLGRDNVSDKMYYENCIGNGCPRAHLTLTVDKNSPEIKAKVDWQTGGVWKYIYYHLNIYIKGPKGVIY